jgi:hypothetical protein
MSLLHKARLILLSFVFPSVLAGLLIAVWVSDGTGGRPVTTRFAVEPFPSVLSVLTPQEWARMTNRGPTNDGESNVMAILKEAGRRQRVALGIPESPPVQDSSTRRRLWASLGLAGALFIWLAARWMTARRIRGRMRAVLPGHRWWLASDWRRGDFFLSTRLRKPAMLPLSTQPPMPVGPPTKLVFRSDGSLHLAGSRLVLSKAWTASDDEGAVELHAGMHVRIWTGGIILSAKCTVCDQRFTGGEPPVAVDDGFYTHAACFPRAVTTQAVLDGLSQRAMVIIKDLGMDVTNRVRQVGLVKHQDLFYAVHNIVQEITESDQFPLGAADVKRRRVYIARGYPEDFTFGTLAHELAHLWARQYKGLGSAFDHPFFEEGFAEYVAAQALDAAGWGRVVRHVRVAPPYIEALAWCERVAAAYGHERLVGGGVSLGEAMAHQTTSRGHSCL